MPVYPEEIKTKEQWDGFITSSNLPASFFQSWNWGEFELSQGKEIHRLGFLQDGEIAGVALAVENDAKRGKFLHIRNGPVLDWNQKFSATEIIDLLNDYGKRGGFDYIRISPQTEKGGLGESLLKLKGYVDSQMHDVDAEITWMLNIDNSEEDLLVEMRKNTRYAIRRAEKDGVKIFKTQDSKYIDDFWEIYKDTVERQQWTAYSKDYIKKEFEIFTADDQAMLFLAEYEGKYIAAAIFIYYNGQTYYHHSGSLTEFRKIPAPYLIQWESIQESKRRGIKDYNFFGIARDDDPNHPWQGLTFFKKGFGGYRQEWIHAKDKPLKLKYWLTNLYELIERRRRGY